MVLSIITTTSLFCPESVLILPPHGLQLESRRGLPSLPLFTLRRFIPHTTLQDMVIHEGMRGWGVHYYLAIIKQVNPKSSVVELAYEVSYLSDGRHLVTNDLSILESFASSAGTSTGVSGCSRFFTESNDTYSLTFMDCTFTVAKISVDPLRSHKHLTIRHNPHHPLLLQNYLSSFSPRPCYHQKSFASVGPLKLFAFECRDPLKSFVPEHQLIIFVSVGTVKKLEMSMRVHLRRNLKLLEWVLHLGLQLAIQLPRSSNLTNFAQQQAEIEIYDLGY